MTTGTPPPLIVVTTGRYDRDAKRARRRGKDLSNLLAIVEDLRHRRPLSARHRDHALVGNWKAGATATSSPTGC